MRLQGEPSWPRAPTQSPQRVPGAEEVPLALHDKEPYIGLVLSQGHFRSRSGRTDKLVEREPRGIQRQEANRSFVANIAHCLPNVHAPPFLLPGATLEFVWRSNVPT